MDEPRRLGILGGTFDPIHYGHLRIAEAVREAFALEHVVFVPNRQPPHKPGGAVSSAEQRYAMTVLAIASNPFFLCSRIEIDRPGPSFAIDTVRAFHRQYPALEALYFITGADTVPEIPTWRDAEHLVQECRFIGVARPGFDGEQLRRSLAPAFQERVSFLPSPGLEVSSTDLRVRVENGHSVKYLLPEPVEEYIRSKNLYQS